MMKDVSFTQQIGSFYDLDENYYDSFEGRDINGGHYDKYGKYIPCHNFKPNLGIYEQNINKSVIDKEDFKEKVKESKKIQFNELREESLENKYILDLFGLPYENNNKFMNLNVFDFDIFFEDEKNINIVHFHY